MIETDGLVIEDGEGKDCNLYALLENLGSGSLFRRYGEKFKLEIMCCLFRRQLRNLCFNIKLKEMLIF